MKKLLLIATAVCFSAGLFAQRATVKTILDVKPVSMQVKNLDDASFVKTPSIVATPVKPAVRGTSEVTVVDLGNSANAYGLYNGGRTALWADPNLNTVAFFHRMLIPPGSGYLAYDVSKDGGNTWTNNIQLYNPTIAPGANARYPQGVIYNPAGNTNPDNAYACTFGPILDGSNAGAGSWGGYGSASIKLDGTGLNQISWPSKPPFRHNVPDAMTINPVTGDIFILDPALLDGIPKQYLDTIVITRGIFNEGLNAYEYEQTAFYAPVVAYGVGIADLKIAFAPDGMTGYIVTLSDNGLEPYGANKAYYPILYKTTDGGVTWDQNPIVVPISGPDGLEGIVNNFFTDQDLIDFFGELVPRDEIVYTTAFFVDLVVDYRGNPILNTVIGISGVHGSNGTAYSIIPASGFIGSFNIFSTDGGDTWYAQKVGKNLLAFRGEWDGGDFVEDNRSQLSITKDGTKAFFSWLDTDFEGAEGNDQPDIFVVGWDIVNNLYTDADQSTPEMEAYNVTFLSDAWLEAFQGTASYYVFENNGEYTIPFVYQKFQNNDPTIPVQYKYIKDFTISEFVWVGTKNVDAPVAGVSQNFPNPFSDVTEVNVTLTKSAKVSVEVFNILGQKVSEIPTRTLGAGTHMFQIKANNLKPGIYTYSVIANGERTTRKMIVQ